MQLDLTGLHHHTERFFSMPLVTIDAISTGAYQYAIILVPLTAGSGYYTVNAVHRREAVFLHIRAAAVKSESPYSGNLGEKHAKQRAGSNPVNVIALSMPDRIHTTHGGGNPPKR